MSRTEQVEAAWTEDESEVFSVFDGLDLTNDELLYEFKSSLASEETKTLDSRRKVPPDVSTQNSSPIMIRKCLAVSSESLQPATQEARPLRSDFATQIVLAGPDPTVMSKVLPQVTFDVPSSVRDAIPQYGGMEMDQSTGWQTDDWVRFPTSINSNNSRSIMPLESGAGTFNQSGALCNGSLQCSTDEKLAEVTQLRSQHQYNTGVAFVHSPFPLPTSTSSGLVEPFMTPKSFMHTDVLSVDHNESEISNARHFSFGYSPPRTGQLQSSISLASDRRESQDDKEQSSKTLRKKRRYRHESFPQKLYRLLQETAEAGKSHIVSFTPSGTAFRVHDPAKFAQDIAPLYFRHNQYHSFQRNLSNYGFERIYCGSEIGAYTHRLFRFGYPILCDQIRRVSEQPSRNSSSVGGREKQRSRRRTVNETESR